MNTHLKASLSAVLLLISIVVVNCVPTSVLVNTKDAVLNNSKVKRSSGTSSGSTTTQKSAPDSHATGTGFKNEKTLEGNHAAGFFETKSAPQKRGVNSQLMYGDIFNTLPTGPVPNGVWGDEVDPSIMYTDLQDFDDYPRGSYRPKSYENLQSILNSGAYPEPVALPLQYPYRYYGDRKKRSNKNLYDMRLKRESKLSPADMLALLALMEAGERTRQETESQESMNDYSKPYFSQYGQQVDNENELMNSWVDPATDYYGIPYNLDDISKYEVLKDQRYVPNHYPTKRYMVAKKKRSLGHFLNEPVAMPSISYDNRFAPQDYLGKGPKRYQKYF